MRTSLTQRVARRVEARLLVLLTAFVLSFLLVNSRQAQAAVTAQMVGTILQVTVSASEGVTITCVGGDAKVNGQEVDGEPDTCSTITAIQITATGSFSNVVDLSQVTDPPFTSVTTITVDAAGGADTVTGSALDDSILAGEGNDFVQAGAGDDTVHGVGGTDLLEGQSNDDSVAGGEQADTLTGGTGDDEMAGEGGDDELADELFSPSGEDTMDGGDGNDSVSGGGADDSLDGGADDDLVDGLGG
ncbi:MAG: hypothetical protein M3135_00335, partial [Actinomycetota bacterium]|nr:hypothetical protein [Actinomycetota bacterium]